MPRLHEKLNKFIAHKDFVTYYEPVQMCIWESSEFKDSIMIRVYNIIDKLEAFGDIRNQKMIDFWDHLSQDEQYFLNRCAMAHNRSVNNYIKNKPINRSYWFQ